MKNASLLWYPIQIAVYIKSAISEIKNRLSRNNNSIIQKSIYHDQSTNHEDMQVGQQENVRIIIFGVAWEEWTKALGPDSLIWPRLNVVN